MIQKFILFLLGHDSSFRDGRIAERAAIVRWLEAGEHLEGGK